MAGVKPIWTVTSEASTCWPGDAASAGIPGFCVGAGAPCGASSGAASADIDMPSASKAAGNRAIDRLDMVFSPVR